MLVVVNLMITFNYSFLFNLHYYLNIFTYFSRVIAKSPLDHILQLMSIFICPSSVLLIGILHKHAVVL